MLLLVVDDEGIIDAIVLLTVETGGVVVCDGHIGKKSINPVPLVALVGVVMGANDGMVVVAVVDSVAAAVVDIPTLG